MSVEEIISAIEELPDADVRRVREAVLLRIRPLLTDREAERELLRLMIEEGLVTQLPDRAKATPDEDRLPPVEFEGPPISEQIIAERR